MATNYRGYIREQIAAFLSTVTTVTFNETPGRRDSQPFPQGFVDLGMERGAGDADQIDEAGGDRYIGGEVRCRVVIYLKASEDSARTGALEDAADVIIDTVRTALVTGAFTADDFEHDDYVVTIERMGVPYEIYPAINEADATADIAFDFPVFYSQTWDLP